MNPPDKLKEISEYQYDWDDQNAEPINPEIIKTGYEILDYLRAANISMPNEISVTANGELIIAWRSVPNFYQEWEIKVAGIAEEMIVDETTGHKIVTYREIVLRDLYETV